MSDFGPSGQPVRGCRPLTSEEVGAIYALLAEGRDRTLFAVCLYSGARLQEALQLRVNDVAVLTAGGWEVRAELVLRRVTTKGRRTSRTVMIHQDLVVVLLEYLRGRELDPADWLFPSDNVRATEAGHLSRVQGWRVLRRAFDLAGLRERTGTHSLRKTFAQALVQRHVPLVVIQSVLGHADIRDTRLYVSVPEEDSRAAVAGIQFSLTPPHRGGSP